MARCGGTILRRNNPAEELSSPLTGKQRNIACNNINQNPDSAKPSHNKQEHRTAQPAAATPQQHEKPPTTGGVCDKTPALLLLLYRTAQLNDSLPSLILACIWFGEAHACMTTSILVLRLPGPAITRHIAPS
ncbi:unnamed protein product, partial [Ectocarpus sp. 13 AM-2016]